MISSLPATFCVGDILSWVEVVCDGCRRAAATCLAEPRFLNISLTHLAVKTVQVEAKDGAPVSYDIDTQEDYGRGRLDNSYS